MPLTQAQRERAIGEIDGVWIPIVERHEHRQAADAAEARANAVIDRMLSVAAWRNSTAAERQSVLEAALANSGMDVSTSPGYQAIVDTVRNQFEVQFAARRG